MRDIRKNVYKAFNGDVMLGTFEGHKYCRRKKKHLFFSVFLLNVMREFITRGTHKDESNIYSKTRNV